MLKLLNPHGEVIASRLSTARAHDLGFDRQIDTSNLASPSCR